MSTLLFRANFRALSRHPLLAALSVVGIALGVAVVVSINLANDSAERAFAMSQRAVVGEATHQVVGGPSGLDETVFVRLRRELGIDRAAPVVEGYVTSPRAPGRALRILGVDPFSEALIRPRLGPEVRADLGALLTQRGAGLVPRALARSMGLGAGDSLPLAIEGRAKELTIVALFEPPDEGLALALEDVFFCDISTAQELLDQEGRLSRIDIILADSQEGTETARLIGEACAGQCELLPAFAQSAVASQMTRAFRLNLSALGLLALVVGMFLTYNTMTFLVVERQALFGTLRAIGVTRRELFRAVIAEALALALPGTALGLAGGIALAKVLVRLVTRTINDLYFVVNVRSLSIEPATLVKAAGVGLVATVISALVPAWEAARAPPSVTLRQSARELALRRSAPALSLLGAAILALAGALVGLSGKSLVASFIALFAVLLGAALAVPLAIRALAAVLRPLASRAFGLSGTMAARGMVTSLTRSSVGVAALMVAVATTVGVSVMVESFRAAVAEWLDVSLRSDLFVHLPSLISRRREGTIAPGVARRIAACDGVAAVNTIRNRRVRTSAGEVDLHAVSYGDPRAQSYQFRRGLSEDVYRALATKNAVAVSEPYAFRRGLSLGSALDIFTDHGFFRFEVAGVYADYASDEGAILMARSLYDRHFDDRGISAMGIVSARGADLDALRERVRACAGDEQALMVRKQRELRETSLAIFDRTFAITTVLRFLSVLVAFFGILSALSALALERSRELAVLRAIGMTPAEVRRLVTVHTALLGLSAGVLSIPLGFLLAFLLVHVINRRSFGWSLELVGSPSVALEALALSLAAALLAGLYPAWKMSRASPAAALRDE